MAPRDLDTTGRSPRQRRCRTRGPPRTNKLCRRKFGQSGSYCKGQGAPRMLLGCQRSVKHVLTRHLSHRFVQLIRTPPLMPAPMSIRSFSSRHVYTQFVVIIFSLSLMRFYVVVTDLLGTTARINAETPSDLALSLAQYVDSREQCPGNTFAYWALIRQIQIRCPSPVLSSGLVLVDLPGVADSNAARSRIAGEYLQKCAHFWVAAPITRAVNDKTAQGAAH